MSAGGERFRVLIVGGGVAGVEAMLALADLAGDLVETVMLAPSEDFVYRPLAVNEPFSYGTAPHYPLAPLVRDAGAELRKGELAFVDDRAQMVHTTAGEAITYDALLLTLGARITGRYKHALTIDDRGLGETMHGLIQDIEGGYVRRIAFVSPGRMAWPLPLYELALMSAARAFDAEIELAVTIVTAEDAPLAVFGGDVSERVRVLLDDARIELIAPAHAEIPSTREIVIQPGERRIQVDRAVALPELYGPSVRGIPLGEHGFIAVDPFGRVRDARAVFAAGDCTEFPVKHGGIAAQQADIAAESIAALAGADLQPARFRPVIEGTLFTGGKPLHMTARLAGGRGANAEAEVSDLATAPKIAARYLTPALGLHHSGLPSASGR
jgi:sulfide:quinone oxidoreductase